MILLDTNILLRMADAGSDDQILARRASNVLQKSGRKVVIVPQNLYEFWAVATRLRGPSAEANGLGLSAYNADRWLDYFRRRFELLSDPPGLPEIWRSLILTYNVTGVKSHDVRFVAAMQAHDIQSLLTFNGKDFKRFPMVEICAPQAI